MPWAPYIDTWRGWTPAPSQSTSACYGWSPYSSPFPAVSTLTGYGWSPRASPLLCGSHPMSHENGLIDVIECHRMSSNVTDIHSDIIATWYVCPISPISKNRAFFLLFSATHAVCEPHTPCVCNIPNVTADVSNVAPSTPPGVRNVRGLSDVRPCGWAKSKRRNEMRLMAEKPHLSEHVRACPRVRSFRQFGERCDLSDERYNLSD